jgi:hypothetical protein
MAREDMAHEVRRHEHQGHSIGWWLRRGLAVGAIATVLTKGGIITEPVKAVQDFLVNTTTDQYHPEADTQHQGGRVDIVFSDSGPTIRSNPNIHDGKDGININTVSPEDLATIGNTPVNITPGTTLEIDDYNTVVGQSATSNLPTAKNEWIVEPATLKDGEKLLIYINDSAATDGSVNVLKHGTSEPAISVNLTPVVKVVNP